MDLIIISGRSGAGKSVVLSALEDQGYYCIDNIPVNLLTSTIKEISNCSKKVALSLDIRNLFYTNDKSTTNNIINSLRESYNTTLLFLDCSPEVIINRYADTRRCHPLMSLEAYTLDEAISKESDFLYNIREYADYLIDTSDTNVHELSSRVNGILDLISNSEQRQFKLIFNSFGFKRRLPPSSNFVFDVRHLPNPFWDQSLRSQTGLDKEVVDFFNTQEEVVKELERIKTYLDGWLDAVDKNTSRKFAVISIGCTGGQHRSVYIADQLARYYSNKKQFKSQSYHYTLKKLQNYF